MARRYRAGRDQNLVIFVGLILLVGLLLPWVDATNVSAVFTNILCIVLAIGIIAGAFLLCRWIIIHFTKQRRALHFASLHAHDVDHMSGKEFEIFLEHLLTSRGFSVKGIYHGNDGGVDIVAKKDKETYNRDCREISHSPPYRPQKQFGNHRQYAIIPSCGQAKT